MSEKDARPIDQPSSAMSSNSRDSQREGLNDLVKNILQNARPGMAIAGVTGEHTVTGRLENHIDSGNGTSIAIGPISRTLHVQGTQINSTGQSSSDRVDSGDSQDDSYLKDLKKKMSSSSGNCYNLDNESCALVINNIFNAPDRDPEYNTWYRRGAEGDTEKVRQLFKDFFKFAFVQKKENVSSETLAEILNDFRKTAKILDCSACFIIIMSHGGKGADSIVMDDLKEVDLYKDIVYKFSDHDVVRTRPKVFLVQACRNSREPVVLDDRRPPLGPIQDILIGHSTIPHLPAGRHVEDGALYFEVIDKVFRKSAAKTLKAKLHEVYYTLLTEHKQKAQIQDFGFQDYSFK